MTNEVFKNSYLYIVLQLFTHRINLSLKINKLAYYGRQISNFSHSHISAGTND